VLLPLLLALPLVLPQAAAEDEATRLTAELVAKADQAEPEEVRRLAAL